MTPSRNKDLWQVILMTGLLAATLDITAACFSYWLNTHKNPLWVLQFVASAVFGKKAFTEGSSMMIMGLLFHYFIALSFTTAFFLLYPHIPFLSKNFWITALLTGIVVWMIMNLVVVPLSKAHIPIKTVPAIRAALILVVAIGFPLTYFARRYFGRKDMPLASA